MKTIMISIYKKHNENIFDTLLKTEEIRKNRPKIDLPFKAVVYEPKKHGGCGKVVGEFVVDRIEQFDSAFSEYAYAVAPRDINCIMPMSEDKAIQLMTTKGCLTLEDTIDYFGDEDYVAYFWHITAPKRYDKPKELGEFRKVCKHYKALCDEKNEDLEYEYSPCYGCENATWNSAGEGPYAFSWYECKTKGIKPITKAPQSFVYLEVE